MSVYIRKYKKHPVHARMCLCPRTYVKRPTHIRVFVDAPMFSRERKRDRLPERSGLFIMLW